MSARGDRPQNSSDVTQSNAARPITRWTPPPLPDFVARAAAVSIRESQLSETLSQSRVAEYKSVTQPAPLSASIQLRAPGVQADFQFPPVPNSVLWAVPEPPPGESYLLDLVELRATADPIPRIKVQTVKREPRRLMQRVARTQAIVGMVAMLAAPLLTLATGRASALAFALHGIGAMLMFGLATMVMHQAYPLLRGGSRTWPTFRTMVGRLAACAVAEGISGVWLLFYYHSETGPGHALAETAPLVDQLAMNIKIFCGLAAVLLCIAAWWSARLVDEGRKDGMVVPALAVAGAWTAMVCTLALGLGIAWVMPA